MTPADPLEASWETSKFLAARQLISVLPPTFLLPLLPLHLCNGLFRSHFGIPLRSVRKYVIWRFSGEVQSKLYLSLSASFLVFVCTPRLRIRFEPGASADPFVL